MTLAIFEYSTFNVWFLWIFEYEYFRICHIERDSIDFQIRKLQYLFFFNYPLLYILKCAKTTLKAFDFECAIVCRLDGVAAFNLHCLLRK